MVLKHVSLRLSLLTHLSLSSVVLPVQIICMPRLRKIGLHVFLWGLGLLLLLLLM